MRALESEVASLREDHGKALSDAEKQHQAAVEAAVSAHAEVLAEQQAAARDTLETEVDALRASLAETTAAEKAALSAELEERHSQEHSDAMSKAAEMHESELLGVSQRSEAALAELSSAHEAELETASQRAQREREAFESELAGAAVAKVSLLGAHESALAAMRSEHGGAVAQAAQKHEAALRRAEAAERELLQAKNDLDAERAHLGDVLAAHRAEVTALQARLDAATQRSKDRGRVERARFARLISGWWQASGTDSDGHGADELLFLEAKADGSLGGIVDDGDGVVGDGDCVLSKGIFDSETGRVRFDQVYEDDGATTSWAARYDVARDALVDGRWSGDAQGVFEATRRAPGDDGSVRVET